jgi:hypothetical protein
VKERHLRIDLSLGLAVAAVVISARGATAQDSTLTCRIATCAVTFEWGNGNIPPDPDRRYGAPSDMESVFLSRMAELGFKTSRISEATTSIVVRLTPLDRAICESMSGTNTDYSCHTVDRAAITMRVEEGAKQAPRVDVIARCSDPKISVTFAQFGKYAAEMLAYTIAGSKGPRPAVKCG